MQTQLLITEKPSGGTTLSMETFDKDGVKLFTIGPINRDVARIMLETELAMPSTHTRIYDATREDDLNEGVVGFEVSNKGFKFEDPSKDANTEEDKVNNPRHYKTASGIEAVHVAEEFDLDLHTATAIIYILRAKHKGSPVEDIEKAIWWLARFLVYNYDKEPRQIEARKPFDKVFNAAIGFGDAEQA